MYLNMKLLLLSAFNLFMILPFVQAENLNCNCKNLPDSKNDIDNIVCLIPDNECTRNQNLSCVNSVRPYIQTSIASAEDFIFPSEIQNYLETWQHLKNVPCWFAIQPHSCAVYTSKCEEGSIFLPFQKMFNITHGPCSSVEDTLPAFLRSENETLHPSRCWNPLQDTKFKTSLNEYQGAEQDIRMLLLVLRISVFSVMVLILTKIPNRHPGIIIFYIFACLWLYNQFFLSKKEIVCLPHEATENDRFYSTPFTMIHYFQMIIVVWYVIITYALHVFFEQTGIILKDNVNKETVSFYVPAWNIPVLLTTAVVAMTDIDANSIRVFFSESTGIRAGFVLWTFLLITEIGAFVLISAVHTSVGIVIRHSKRRVNLHVKKKIRHALFKIGIFAAIVTVLVICTSGMHCSYSTKESLRVYFIENSASSYSSIGELPRCQLKSHLSIAVVFFGIPFGLVIITALWIVHLIMNISFYCDEENKSISEGKSVVENQSAIVGNLSLPNQIE